MALIEGLRKAFGADAAEAGTADERTHRCIDCHAEFDDRKQLCPKCGGEQFKHA